MVPLTRRRLLQGTAGLVAGVAAGLAGCNGLDGRRESTTTATRAIDESGPGSGADATTDPAALRVRSADDRPPVWLTDPGDGDDRPTPGEHSRHLGSIVVDGPSRADRIALADVPAGERARSFLADTAFDRETVYVESFRVRECFRLDLCGISWGKASIETDYARTLRPYDERCAADAWAAESWLVRIPAALSGEDVNGHTTSVGSAACDGAPGRGEAEGEGGSVDGSGAALAPDGDPDA